MSSDTSPATKQRIEINRLTEAIQRLGELVDEVNEELEGVEDE